MLKIVYYAVALFVFFVIWFPVINHYYVPNIRITEEEIEKARTIPDDSVLDEITSFFRSRKSIDEEQLIATAEHMLQGKIEISGHSSRTITMPFDVDDIDKGLPKWRLAMASFEIPGLLLDAYELTGQDDFILTARDVITGWALYERTAWLPKGFLWNDHAISARIAVLAKFWKLYRNHPAYNEEAAKDIFQMVSRSGQLSSRPSHFTFATNHGIMQNLTLWQICIAFPTLPGIESFRQLALERISDQFSFYINDEGVVLEHSAGYHRDGLEFISLIFRYMTLLNIAIPEEWTMKFEKAKKVYAQLRRPDGSLPRYGDTTSWSDIPGPLVTNMDANGQSKVPAYQYKWRPGKPVTLYPVAGYSVWWDGLDYWPDEQMLNQTVVIWSYYPGHAHKHADEMSMLLYAGGQSWLTNTGFWDYGTKGRINAVSWEGSNAPHVAGEKHDSKRYTELKFHGDADGISIIDIERKGPDNYVARRQAVHLRPNLWIIIDNTFGDSDSRTTTTWTTFFDIKLSEDKMPGVFSLKGNNENVSLKAIFFTSGDEKPGRYKGSYTPFAGWAGKVPAEAIVIDQPAHNSWAVSIWALEKTLNSHMIFTKKPYMQKWGNAGSWKIVIPAESGLLSISRDNNRVLVNRGSEIDSIQEVKLKAAPPDIRDKYNTVRTGYKNAADKYPKFRDFLTYRWKITYFLIFIFILQEIFFIVYKRRKGTYYTGLRIFTMIGWISIIALWQMLVYLKT